MLTTKVTKKQIKESYRYIISAKYCETQNLLNGRQRRFYYSNIYGWRMDIYEIDYNTVLTDGYDYIINHKNQDKIDEIIEKYDKKAYKIKRENHPYNIINKKLETNLQNCIKELKGVIDNEN